MITTIGFTTRGRLESLERCVRSFIKNARQFGRNPRLLIVDDAIPGMHPSSRSIAERLGRDHRDFEVWYVGYEEKRRFIESLERGGLPRDVLEFGLLDPENTGYTLGANRNALQLATLGEQVLYVDDDCRAVTARPPQWSEDLVVAGLGSTQQYWYYRDHESALGAATFAPTCVLTLHERFLGKPCGVVMEEELPNESASGKTGWGRSIKDGAVVKITQTGMVGDSCMFSNIGHLLHAGNQSLARLSASKESLEMAMSSREIIRAPAAPTLRLGGLLIGPAYGCDQSTLLPPYMPVFRSSDSTFSCTLSVVYPSYAYADIPWLIVHKAERGRGYNNRGFSEVWHCSVGEVIRSLLYTHSAYEYHSFIDPLNSKGQKFLQVGGLSPDEFASRVQTLVDEMIQMKIDRLSKLLALSENPPPYYMEAMNRSIGLLEGSLGDEMRCVPVELRQGRTPSEVLIQTQRFVRRFGELLTVWQSVDRFVREHGSASLGLAVRM